jgi:hypothetical protein
MYPCSENSFSICSASLSSVNSSTPTAIVPSVLPYTTCVNGDFREFCTKVSTASLLYQTGMETKADMYVLISGTTMKANDYGYSSRHPNHVVVKVHNG